jgi:hypothetical protein|tara:strand:+ start:3036 stop:3251 length:216 start_codon:yes stop_codon:yes gene_type:complete
MFLISGPDLFVEVCKCGARAMANRNAAMPSSSIRSARMLLELDSSYVSSCLEREREALFTSRRAAGLSCPT